MSMWTIVHKKDYGQINILSRERVEWLSFTVWLFKDVYVFMKQ